MILKKYIKDKQILQNYKMVKVLSPFGPKIAKLRFSKQLINKINFEVDKINSNKPLVKKLDYSKKLVGQVKQEISLPISFIKKNLDKIISKNIKDFKMLKKGELGRCLLFCSWMCRAVSVLHFGELNFRIFLSSSQAFMAKYFLNHVNVCTCI